jgi:hypothetical protein
MRVAALSSSAQMNSSASRLRQVLRDDVAFEKGVVDLGALRG